MAKRIVIIRDGGQFICAAAAEEVEILVIDRQTEFSPEESIMDIEGQPGACQVTTAVNDPAWLVELWGDYEQGVKDNESN